MKRAFLVLVLLACAPPLSAQAPDEGGYLIYPEVVETQPTSMHRFLFSMMAECLGVEDDSDAFDRIQWTVVDFILRVDDYTRMAGLWNPETRRIYLDRTKWLDANAVSHELIHDLTDGEIEEDDPTFARCEVREWVP